MSGIYIQRKKKVRKIAPISIINEIFQGLKGPAHSKNEFLFFLAPA